MTPHFLNRDKGKLVLFPTDPFIYLILICTCKLLVNSHASIHIIWKSRHTVSHLSSREARVKVLEILTKFSLWKAIKLNKHSLSSLFRPYPLNTELYCSHSKWFIISNYQKHMAECNHNRKFELTWLLNFCFFFFHSLIPNDKVIILFIFWTWKSTVLRT